jgi:hypothetical protein
MGKIEQSETATAPYGFAPGGPRSVVAAQAIFVLGALMWLVLAIVTLGRWASSRSIGILILTALMVGNAAVMSGLAWGLRSQRRRIWFAAVLWAVVNVLLTFTDQVGIVDLISLALPLGMLGLLLATRATYRRPG